ncbi:MAG: HAMP domain-containing histidine kinase [Polyangiaceae bacterium]|nr:HAMP domain-containing histidine kinase [Polyangiaceae bacterium]
MKVPNLLRSRLALRIYLTGLAQVAIVAAGFFAIVIMNRPPFRPPMHDTARVLADQLIPIAGDRASLARELAKVHDEQNADVMIVGPDGHDYVSSPDAESFRCPRGPHPFPPPRPGERTVGRVIVHDREGPIGRPIMCAVVPMPLPIGPGELHFLGKPPQSPPSLAPRIVPLVLLVVGVSSLLLAWSLVRPLQRMSAAARAFGAGDMTARVNIRSKDELGEVARAFDEMAARVTTLLRAERELLANVSHELRTPLARIRVALDLAVEGDAAVAREALTDIAGDLDELERLLSDVLTAARLDLDETRASGLPPLRREDVDTQQLVENAAQRFRTAHPERILDIEIDGPLPPIHGDPVLLRRLLENLIVNAHKYTEKSDAPVTVKAASETGSIVIDVVDRGIGISKEDLPLVFRPFFRADRSRTRATGGLGLGLALAKRIAEAHGGTIEMESELGRGTRARVVLPA